jgi:hypothetical protein
MFVLAAHTGARRSEMMRFRVEDFDFDPDRSDSGEEKGQVGADYVPQISYESPAGTSHEGLVRTVSRRHVHILPPGKPDAQADFYD